MTSADKRDLPSPRFLRSAPDPLGLYVRVGRNDHCDLLDLLARSDAHCFGFVFDATSVKRHKELRERVLAARLDAILDPRTQPAATIGGHSNELASLPWGLDRPHRVDDFENVNGRNRIAAIAEFAVEHGFTQVLAPTHLLSASDDPWFGMDCESTRLLRQGLDRVGGSRVQIHYSLAIPYSLLRDDVERDALVDALGEVPADTIWLRIDGLGSDATANGVRSYILGANAFKALHKPVIADGIGGIAGLSLLAFGAAGGIVHGVTLGERVSNSSWRRPRNNRGFGTARRVYVAELDLMLKPVDAETLIRSSSRASGVLGCRDTQCCPRGIRDMIENPARHFLIQRMAQVGALGRLPPTQRAARFVDDTVRPASDMLAHSTNWKIGDDDLMKVLRNQRRRMDALRLALVAQVKSAERQPVLLPRTRASRDLRAGI